MENPGILFRFTVVKQSSDSCETIALQLSDDCLTTVKRNRNACYYAKEIGKFDKAFGILLHGIEGNCFEGAVPLKVYLLIFSEKSEYKIYKKMSLGKLFGMEPDKTLYNRNKKLWTRFISGDDSAFAEIYTLNVDAMLDYGLHFTPLKDLVKDAIQDVFVKIYNKRGQLGSVENLRLYLFIALKNYLFSFFNKDQYHYQIDTLEPVFSLENSVEDIYIGLEIKDEQQRYIKQMLNLLSPRQREAIYYRYTEGMSFDEICEIMQMNTQSVRNLLHRSIIKIRETYAGYNTQFNKVNKK